MRKSRLEWAVQRRLIEHFVSGSTARTAASLVGVNKSTAALYFHRLRQIIVQESEDASPLFGEIEVDESYFARHRNFHPQETGFPLSIYGWWESQPLKTWGGPVILQSDLDRFIAAQSAARTKTLWLVSYEASYYAPHAAFLVRLRQVGEVTEFRLPPEPRVYEGESSPRLIRVSLR